MAKNQGELFEQYKLAIGSTEKVSDQRADANKFYLSVNSIIAGGLLFYANKVDKVNKSTVAIAVVFGIVVSILWFLALVEYKKLNGAKFKLIHEMETKLSFSFYTKEWALLNEGKRYQKYKTVAKWERRLPLTFIFVYLAIFVSLTRMN